MSFFSTAGSFFASALSFIPLPSFSSARKPQEDSFENELDPLSLIMSLAAASLLSEGIKPIQINHHIKWGSSIEYGTKILKIEASGAARTYENVFGSGIAKKEVIDSWEETIEKAAYWYEPHREENKIIREFFETAIIGLENVKKTYKGKLDEKIDSCIEAVQNAVQKKGLTGKEQLLLKIKEIWRDNFNELIRLHAQGVIQQGDSLEDKQNKFPDVWDFITANVDDDWYQKELYESEVIQGFFDKAVTVLTRADEKLQDPLITKSLRDCVGGPLSEKIKLIWQKCFIESVSIDILLAKDIASRKKTEENDENFKAKIQSVFSIIDARCKEFDKVFKRNTKT